MSRTESCVTIHMVASLDGFIARKVGRVDWLETSDEFPGGLGFEAKGFGWSYGDTPSTMRSGSTT